MLCTNGFRLEGKLMDIQLMHYLINPEKSHKIDILSRSYLDINIEELASSKEPAQELSLFDEVDTDADASDRFPEAAATMLLGECIMKEMKELGVDSMYDTMEEPLLKVLSDMELEGVKVDLAQLRKYASSLSAELEKIQKTIREMADEPGLNIMSPKQIGTILFEKLKIDPKIKPKNGVRYNYPTDEETLSALADKHPIVNEILEFRGVKKLL